MIQFYFYPSWILLILFIAAIFNIAFQTAYIGISIYNNNFKKNNIISEIVLLMYFCVFSLQPIYVLNNIRYGLFQTEDLYFLLNLLAVVLVIITVIYKQEKWQMIIIGLIFAQSFIFNIINIDYPFLFLIALSLFLYRSFIMTITALEKQKNELSLSSIKNGINTLPSGVIFSDTNGYIYLINRRMKDLVDAFFEKEQRNANEFWENLKQGNIVGATVSKVGSDLLLKSGNKSFRFSRIEFIENNKKYYEIIAVDVTKTMLTLEELEEDKLKLISQSREILMLSNNMQTLKKEQEYSRIRTKVHDVMSQRLTIIQRTIQSKDINDYKNTALLLKDIIKQIKQDDKGNVREVFLELCEYFNQINLEIILTGDLPENEEIAIMFLAVLREATTNASRHAGATKVFSKIDLIEDTYIIEITNNGKNPTKSIKEGSGISGMRNRVENMGGKLRVEIMPEFTIVISIKTNNLD